MVSNVFPGHSFYHAGRYISEKPGAELLYYLGVRGFDYKLMAEDFARQNALRPSKKKACFHAALSFYPGEKPTDKALTQIAQEYLEGLGIVNTQYIIVKHTDRAHLHLHVLANMVDNDGESINDSWIGLRGKKVAQELTRKYHLVPAKGKNLDLTHLDALSESEANRYKIYQAIVDSLPHCRSLADLEKRLLAKGIQTQYKYKGQTQELQGISFRIGKDRFKGSQIDRKFSLAGLQKAILAMRQNRDITAWLSPNERKRAILVKSTTQQSPGPVPAPKLEISPMLVALLKHIETEGGGGVPYELTDAYRRKKKKKKGPSL
jgi:hypothetical protein